ncbi:MAG: hypothetical protein AAFQ21_12755 [Pseudomonadota bacterium]
MDFKIATHLGEDPHDADFPAFLDSIIASNKKMLHRKDFPNTRAQHPKGHATLEAEFSVLELSDEDKELREGIFATPSETPHKALVRFSNSNEMVDDPEAGDAHGMAVKIFGIKGDKFEPDPDHADTFDLIFINSEIFVEGNLKKYTRLNDLAGEMMDLKRNGGSKVAGVLNFLWLKFLHFFDKAQRDAVAKVSSQKPYSLTTEHFWSTTPYLLGPDRAVKYVMKPTNPNDKDAEDRSENYLLKRLIKALSTGPCEFTLQVQVKMPGAAYPIEDPRIPWDGAKTVDVAKLTILPLNLTETPEEDLRKVWGEREKNTYNIWNVTAAHRPLGALNWVRRKVYATLKDTRR